MAKKVMSPKTKMSQRGTKRLRTILPFLQTMKELKPAQRGIMLAHLDDNSCQILCEAAANVLTNPRITKQRKKLREALLPHKKILRTLATTNGRNVGFKRKTLYKLGANPLGYILSAAVPLLLDLLRG
jgi:hypothetical protein